MPDRDDPKAPRLSSLFAPLLLVRDLLRDLESELSSKLNKHMQNIKVNKLNLTPSDIALRPYV